MVWWWTIPFSNWIGRSPLWAHQDCTVRQCLKSSIFLTKPWCLPFANGSLETSKCRALYAFSWQSPQFRLEASLIVSSFLVGFDSAKQFPDSQEMRVFRDVRSMCLLPVTVVIKASVSETVETVHALHSVCSKGWTFAYSIVKCRCSDAQQ